MFKVALIAGFMLFLLKLSKNVVISHFLWGSSASWMANETG